MRKAFKKNERALQPEYDLSKLRGGVRGKYFRQATAGTNLVLIEPGLASFFPDAAAVNRALRLVVEASEVVAREGRARSAKSNWRRTRKAVKMVSRFIGVDVQTARGCAFSVLDASGAVIDAGWLNDNATVEALREVIENQAIVRHGIAVAIDAPRMPLAAPRNWYWRSGHWMPREPNDKGHGRHCEVVIKAHGLANPQWTPVHEPYPGWMQLGFKLFREPEGLGCQVYEVFPSASYSILQGDNSLTLNVRLGDFAEGPKDMLDSYIAAATLREYIQGRGCEVGGGDGLGTIVLPRPLPNPIHSVLSWPTE